MINMTQPKMQLTDVATNIQKHRVDWLGIGAISSSQDMVYPSLGLHTKHAVSIVVRNTRADVDVFFKGVDVHVVLHGLGISSNPRLMQGNLDHFSRIEALVWSRDVRE